MHAGCVHRYVSDSPPVVDPYAASALRSSSRPITPQVAPGGLRGPAALQTAESSARWAAAALRGRATPGSALAASHGAGKRYRNQTKIMLQVSSRIQAPAYSVDISRLKQRSCLFQTGLPQNNNLFDAAECIL